MDFLSTSAGLSIIVELDQVLSSGKLSSSKRRTELRKQFVEFYTSGSKMPPAHASLAQECQFRSHAVFNLGKEYLIGKYFEDSDLPWEEQEQGKNVIAQRAYQEMFCTACYIVLKKSKKQFDVFRIINTNRIPRIESQAKKRIVQELRGQKSVLLFMQLVLEYYLMGRVYSYDVLLSLPEISYITEIFLGVQDITLVEWRQLVQKLAYRNI